MTQLTAYLKGVIAVCRIVIEISDKKIVKLVASSSRAEIIIIDNDNQTIKRVNKFVSSDYAKNISLICDDVDG